MISVPVDIEAYKSGREREKVWGGGGGVL
jgi:hypothetical protein